MFEARAGPGLMLGRIEEGRRPDLPRAKKEIMRATAKSAFHKHPCPFDPSNRPTRFPEEPKKILSAHDQEPTGQSIRNLRF